MINLTTEVITQMIVQTDTKLELDPGFYLVTETDNGELAVHRYDSDDDRDHYQPNPTMEVVVDLAKPVSLDVVLAAADRDEANRPIGTVRFRA